MILAGAEDRFSGRVLENGTGIGLYLEKLANLGGMAVGLDFEFDRCIAALEQHPVILNGAGENLPFPESCFDLILSNEVIEHVEDDRLTISEMVRTLRPGGRMIVFCPNRWYPFETHGIYWQGKYYFGNKFMINYMPRKLRDKLVPHVRAYTRKELSALFRDLPVKYISQKIIYGGYDNIIARYPRLGKILRSFLYWLEKTPLQSLGLSHFLIIEKERQAANG
jgi:SAM-dependent methyltransferase